MEMTDTFNDILKMRDKDTAVATSVDAATPAGYFLATTKMLGLVRTYLLEGEIDDENAPIKGVVTINKDGLGAIAYRSTSLMGGYFIGPLSDETDGYAGAFARILSDG